MSKQGGFTIPGEAGYEELTLSLAKKWGADAVRDSDGTTLSPQILSAGLDVYSTVCIIRDHNDWINKNPNMQQQTFLITAPKTAVSNTLTIDLLSGYFTDHVSVNDRDDSIAYWQVTDRTANKVLNHSSWRYENGKVVIEDATPWHTYTVSFLAWRIWEEISMYNHTTNNWDSEHLMQLDPVYPQAQEYLLKWMDNWCKEHPNTDVVRFTSLFYNFTWIWGANEKNRNIFVDWGSYAFAASPLMLDNFEKAYGYALSAEDFVNGGKYRTTHMTPDSKLLDWMEFVSDFVADFAKQLVDIVHQHDKEAYVFYDDCWIGLEPYGKRFSSIGFDGIIKCVFSGFEARLCSDVKGVTTHEIRLHPYLFPVGLGGAPTFSEGGDPTKDALEYWVAVRRAMLRAPIERIGLGGYLSLTENFPQFSDAIAKIADEFRLIQDLHTTTSPLKLNPVIGVLTAWGALRSWTCCGHYHENPDNDLINILESLSGLPFEVRFLSFDDIRNGVADDISLIINAGFAESAWSGGDNWQDEQVLASLTKWVHKGGALLGVGAPSAVLGYDTFFRLAQVFGVDLDLGQRTNHGKWNVCEENNGIYFEKMHPQHGIYITHGDVKVYCTKDKTPVYTENNFGKGLGIYLSSYRHSNENVNSLNKLILQACKCVEDDVFLCKNKEIECAVYPSAESSIALIINNSSENIKTSASLCGNELQLEIEPYGMLKVTC